MKDEDSSNSVLKPKYYKGKTGLQVFDIVDEFDMNYYVGNISKYLIRAGKKDKESKLKDLNKAMEYLKRYIENEGGFVDALPVIDPPYSAHEKEVEDVLCAAESLPWEWRDAWRLFEPDDYAECITERVSLAMDLLHREEPAQSSWLLYAFSLMAREYVCNNNIQGAIDAGHQAIAILINMTSSMRLALKLKPDDQRKAE